MPIILQRLQVITITALTPKDAKHDGPIHFNYTVTPHPLSSYPHSGDASFNLDNKDDDRALGITDMYALDFTTQKLNTPRPLATPVVVNGIALPTGIAFDDWNQVRQFKCNLKFIDNGNVNDRWWGMEQYRIQGLFQELDSNYTIINNPSRLPKNITWKLLAYRNTPLNMSFVTIPGLNSVEIHQIAMNGL